MATYAKEKNIITFVLDDNRTYRLDIQKGEMYGKSGKALKTCPVGEIRNILRANNNHITRAINITLESRLESLPNHLKVFQGGEVAESLALGDRYLSKSNYIYIAENGKYIAKVIKEKGKDLSFYDIQRAVEFLKDKSNYPNIDDFTEEQWRDIKYQSPRYNTVSLKDNLDIFNYYLNKQKMWDYSRSSQNIFNYLKWCSLMNKQPQKVSNFMREYVETKHSYELYKEQFDNVLIAKNYALHSNAWEFKYGNYKILIPKSAQDLVIEGNRMHHCVGGYGQDIINNHCYICFVRKINDLDTPYITCQVYTDGKIGQYYLAYDRHISEIEDIDFKQAFQRHLNAVWGK